MEEPLRPFSQAQSFIAFKIPKEMICHIILSHEEQEKYLLSVMRLQLK